ncbi:MAG: hypothetical protein Q4G71_05495 [Pseudomonadota bacterium]|nr:hypothetical protein [Pseudomonadota bacterium]
MSLSIGAGNYLLGQQTLKSATRSAAQATSAKRAAPARVATNANTRFAPSGSSAGLNTLVAVYPGAERGQARQGYGQLRDAYPQVARQLGLPLNDVASALASFLVGSYMAYHNTPFADAHVKPLADQMRGALASEGGCGRMSDAEKESIYDQMVMLGMMMATTQVQLQQQPDARVEAQLREVGRQFLEGMLQVKADRVRLTAAGLRIE